MVASDLNLSSLQSHLDKTLDGFGPLQGVETAGSGQSNPTYILTGAQDQQVVLRRKPFGTLLPSAHAIDREFKVMKALAGSGIPVPRMLSYCEDPEVLGAEFLLMERVVGQAPLDPRLPSLNRSQRQQVFLDMADILGRLHGRDLGALGLSDFGAPGPYFPRNFARWTKQYRASQTEVIAPLETLIEWLGSHMPEPETRKSLLHGDYRLDNFLIDPATGRIVAVVDWELSTTGHPLSDLGAVLMQWSLPPGGQGRGLAGVNRQDLGIPDDAAFTRAYLTARGDADVPGASVLSDLNYATAFAFFRMAAILQGVVRRGRDGNAADPEAAAQMASYIPLFAAGGLQAAGLK